MRRSATLICAALLVLVSRLSRAEGWSCGPDLEVQCTAESCAVSPEQGVIPIFLSFDSRGKFMLCAYSGCWEGKGKVVSSSPFLVITKKQVDWSDPNQRVEGREDVLIAFSPSDKVVMVKAGSISMPMRCSKAPRPEAGT
jgi:hypothetical protein